MNIVLKGMSGAGKSTLGVLLAKAVSEIIEKIQESHCDNSTNEDLSS